MSFVLASKKVKMITLCVPRPYWCDTSHCSEGYKTLSKRTASNRIHMMKSFLDHFGHISTAERNNPIIWHGGTKHGEDCNIAPNKCPLHFANPYYSNVTRTELNLIDRGVDIQSTNISALDKLSTGTVANRHHNLDDLLPVILFYVYPLEKFPIFFGPDSTCDLHYINEKHGSHKFALEAMMHHPWRTLDPLQADIAFIPSAIDVFKWEKCGPSVTEGDVLQKILDVIHKSPIFPHKRQLFYAGDFKSGEFARENIMPALFRLESW